jgi:hypothetical protein
MGDGLLGIPILAFPAYFRSPTVFYPAMAISGSYGGGIGQAGRLMGSVPKKEHVSGYETLARSFSPLVGRGKSQDPPKDGHSVLRLIGGVLSREPP